MSSNHMDCILTLTNTQRCMEVLATTLTGTLALTTVNKHSYLVPIGIITDWGEDQRANEQQAHDSRLALPPRSQPQDMPMKMDS
jgi:hypothetical protein